MDQSALLALSYGLYVVGSRRGDKLNGQIANTVFQITADPVRVAVSINRTELTHELMSETGRCSVGVLSQTADMPFIGNFGFRSGRDTDKFEKVPYMLTGSGCPVPEEHILAYLDVAIEEQVDVGTHTVFIGRVTDCGISATGVPMTYSHYREVLCGKTPPTAPSHMPASCDTDPPEGEGSDGAGPREERESEMQKYECSVCGYVYDPEKGDPDSGIKPGTSFEDLPDDWVCPVCGVGKDMFNPA